MSTSTTELYAELLNKNKFITHVLNATVDIISVIDKEGKRVFTNNAAAIILGSPKNELIGHSIFDVVYQKDEIKTINILKRVQEQKIIPNFENRLVKKDGTLVYMSWNLHWDEDTEFIYITGRDISARKQSEEQLRASEKKYKQLFDFSGTGNFLIDKDGVLLDVNKRAASLFNAKPSDVIGKNLRDFFLPEIANKYIQFIREIIENGGSRKYEDTFTLLGVERTFMITDCAIQNSESKNFAMLSIGHDITERKQAELKLEDSEKRFRSIIENLSVGVVKYKPNTEIMICNKAALRMLGLTKAQLMGITPYDTMWKVIHEDGSDFPPSTHPVSVAIATNKSVHNVVMGVYRPHTKDSVWLQANARPQFFEDGKLECVTVTFADITEKKKMEAAIASQLKRYRMLMHTSQDFIQILDGNGKLLEWNYAFAKHLGYPEAEIAGMYAWDWSPAFTKEAVLKILANVKDEGISFEAQHLLKDGSLRSVDVKLNRFLSDGQAFYYASARDITELKNKQWKIEKLNEELRGLSIHMQNLIEKERAGLAKEIHDEFGQTFVAISMNAELMSQKIKGKNDELATLINEQIKMSHKVISASRMMFNSLYPTMLEDLGLTAAIESYLETGNLKFCSFKFDLNTNIRDEVVSKEISLVLYRIFQESMTNIALHAKATKVTADIYIEGEYIRMQIADNGIGFVKLSVNTKEHHGLLVMRERTYAMNGKFNISSTLFKGTTVEVIIPLSERQLNENFF